MTNEHRLTFLEKLTREEVLSRVDQHWDFSYRVPFPKFNPKCPQCESRDILIKSWTFFKREGNVSEHPERCDTKFKCKMCSHVWPHGVVVTKEYHPGRKEIINYKEIRRELLDAESQ